MQWSPGTRRRVTTMIPASSLRRGSTFATSTASIRRQRPRASSTTRCCKSIPIASTQARSGVPQTSPRRKRQTRTGSVYPSRPDKCLASCHWLATPDLSPRGEATVSPRAVHSETTRRCIMLLGMSMSAFTLFHVVVSLIAIVTGIIVAVTMLGSKTTNGWTAIFLATTALTSITGFLFQRDQVLPSHIVGAVSLLVLIIAIAALYGYRLARSWRWRRRNRIRDSSLLS